MKIISSTDDGYLVHFAALLHSAWLYNPDLSYGLIDTGISPSNLETLRKFASRLGIDLSIFPAAEKIRDALPGYAKRSAFGRVFIPELLPLDETRALYLDADMTVVGKLDELLATPLDDSAAAVCLDSIQMTIDNETRIQGIDYKGRYFNSGMMVMNLDRWRRDDIPRKVFQFARDYPGRLPYMDQSAINILLQGQVKIIDKKWNFFNLADVNTMDVRDLRIIHHTNNERPWKSALNPFAELYRFHRDRTPWPMGKPLRLPLSEKIQRWKRRIFGAFGSARYKSKADIYRDYDKCRRCIAVPA